MSEANALADLKLVAFRQARFLVINFDIDLIFVPKDKPVAIQLTQTRCSATLSTQNSRKRYFALNFVLSIVLDQITSCLTDTVFGIDRARSDKRKRDTIASLETETDVLKVEKQEL